MRYGVRMIAQAQQINGAAAPAPLLTERAIEEWATRMGVDPSLVGLDDDGYPCADGEPMAENQRHFENLLYGGGVIVAWFGNRPDVFVGVDMLVHGAQSGTLRSVAPDIFVAFGARIGDELMSYKLWEDGPAPSFVMEMLSQKTKKKDIQTKPDIYARMGVTEYWLFDPIGKDIPGQLAAYRLEEGVYRPIPPLQDGSGYRSSALELEIRTEDGVLRVRDPVTGKDLEGLQESWEAHEETKARLADAEARLMDSEARSDEAQAQIAELKAQLARLQDP